MCLHERWWLQERVYGKPHFFNRDQLWTGTHLFYLCMSAQARSPFPLRSGRSDPCFPSLPAVIPLAGFATQLQHKCKFECPDLSVRCEFPGRHCSTVTSPFQHTLLTSLCVTVQAWSDCVDSERDSGRDFTEECRSKVSLSTRFEKHTSRAVATRIVGSIKWG